MTWYFITLKSTIFKHWCWESSFYRAIIYKLQIVNLHYIIVHIHAWGVFKSTSCFTNPTLSDIGRTKIGAHPAFVLDHARVNAHIQTGTVSRSQSVGNPDIMENERENQLWHEPLCHLNHGSGSYDNKARTSRWQLKPQNWWIIAFPPDGSSWYPQRSSKTHPSQWQVASFYWYVFLKWGDEPSTSW